MHIGQLAARSGTPIQTVRYYERIGLMPPPPRGASGYREYRQEHLERILFLRRCRELGFSIRETSDLVGYAEHPGQSCTAVTKLAQRRLAEVQKELAELRRQESRLDALIAACTNGCIAECKILEPLGRPG